MIAHSTLFTMLSVQRHLRWQIYLVKFRNCPPPTPTLGVQILSNSCSFWENLAKSYVGVPWRVGVPTSGKSWICHWPQECMLQKSSYILIGKPYSASNDQFRATNNVMVGIVFCLIPHQMCFASGLIRALRRWSKCLTFLTCTRTCTGFSTPPPGSASPVWNQRISLG